MRRERACHGGGQFFVSVPSPDRQRRTGRSIGLSWNFNGSLEGTPVFLGCSDVDPHIPRERVEESARELARIGGAVDLQIYRGMGHTVNRDELDRVQRMLDRVGAR